MKVINHRHLEYVDYSTQKPKELVKRFIKASTNECDIIADFYIGSGTTIVAASELNRKFIGCDLNMESINITKKRLKVKKKNRIF